MVEQADSAIQSPAEGAARIDLLDVLGRWQTRLCRRRFYFPITQSTTRSMARAHTGQKRSVLRVNMMQSVEER